MAAATLSSSFITTSSSGARTHILQSGDPSAPLLICLHGLGGSTETFIPLYPSLPDTFRIVLVDFQGHGQTPLADPTKPISVVGHVADLHDIITSLQRATSQSPQGTRKVVLIGHSLGAIVSLHYAAAHPDGVAGLALLGSGRAAGHIPAVRQRMLDLAANVRSNGIDVAAEIATTSNFYEDTPERAADPAAREAVRKAVAGSDPEGYAQTCEALVDLGHTDPRYEDIKCPTLFIAGDKDLISPVDRSRGLSELVGGESWVEVVKSGHQQILEDLDAVQAAVKVLFEKIQI